MATTTLNPATDAEVEAFQSDAFHRELFLQKSPAERAAILSEQANRQVIADVQAAFTKSNRYRKAASMDQLEVLDDPEGDGSCEVPIKFIAVAFRTPDGKQWDYTHSLLLAVEDFAKELRAVLVARVQREINGQ